MRIKGFTLIEWLVAFSILLIILMETIPSQSNFLTQVASNIAASQLLQAINLARHAALSHGEKTILCASDNQKNCSGTWAQGYIITEQQSLLYTFHNTSTYDALYWRAFPKHQTALIFLPSGNASIENGTFWYCRRGMNKPSWALIVSQVGRVRKVDPAGLNGEIRDGRGRLLTC